VFEACGGGMNPATTEVSTRDEDGDGRSVWRRNSNGNIRRENKSC
jgi:hypothetical protein